MLTDETLFAVMLDVRVCNELTTALVTLLAVMDDVCSRKELTVLAVIVDACNCIELTSLLAMVEKEPCIELTVPLAIVEKEPCKDVRLFVAIVEKEPCKELIVFTPMISVFSHTIVLNAGYTHQSCIVDKSAVVAKGIPLRNN
jgi:hypothetical protein